jgi:hypothetical protein
LRGHIGMRPRRPRSQHPDKPRYNISGPALLHKDKGYARTWPSLDLPFAISSSSVSISLCLDQGICTASPFIAFGFPNVATRSDARFSLRLAPPRVRKRVQGATPSRRADALETISQQSGTRVYQRNLWSQLTNPAFFPCCVIWHQACFAMCDGGESYETGTTHRSLHSILTGRASDIIRAAGPNRL